VALPEQQPEREREDAPAQAALTQVGQEEALTQVERASLTWLA
jgi:hypothetical protein